jgi:hypothetical protein
MLLHSTQLPYITRHDGGEPEKREFRREYGGDVKPRLVRIATQRESGAYVRAGMFCKRVDLAFLVSCPKNGVLERMCLLMR